MSIANHSPARFIDKQPNVPDGNYPGTWAADCVIATIDEAERELKSQYRHTPAKRLYSECVIVVKEGRITVNAVQPRSGETKTRERN